MNILNDRNLSYKAIGLYIQLRNMPHGAKPTIQYLTKIHKDGVSSVEAGIDELVKGGWLEMIPIRENGKFCGYEWVLFDKESH